jgi:hypothetical protein
MPRVRFADDFFRKERDQAYADWRLSVWRELFQNAIDQNAGEIRIGLVPDQLDANCVNLHFADNGPGMTRDVLENVYFAVGATTKSGPGQIGGMGRARVLTCFSMQSYKLASQNYTVIGKGGDYEVYDTAYTPGCVLDITVDNATVEQLEDKLLTFLSESRINANVIVNGERATTRAPLNGRFVRNLDYKGTTFARVFVNKSAPQRLIVRVNGVSMYTRRISAKAQVVVELDPALSRSVLTSNRDGMHWSYGSVLDDFLTALAADTTSAIRPRFTCHTTVARAGGMNKVSTPAISNAQRRRAVAEVIEAWRDKEIEPTEQNTQRYHELSAALDDTHNEVPVFDDWLKTTFGDLYIYDQTESAEMHKAVSAYLPENWKVTMLPDGRTFRKGGNIVRVLLLWKTAIAYALEVALEPLGKAGIDYAVGFIFADDRVAEHRSVADGDVFCLRPVNKTGKLDYSVTNRVSLKRLMTYAKHEVTHIAERYHDEDFSRMREEIDIRFDQAECLRRMKTALRSMPDAETEALGWDRAA